MSKKKKDDVYVKEYIQFDGILKTFGIGTKENNTPGRKGANERDIDISDCAVRAISYATKKSYDKVYKKLCNRASKVGDTYCSSSIAIDYLKDHGWKMNDNLYNQRKCPNGQLSVLEFMLMNPKGKFIVSANCYGNMNHLFVYDNGVYVDNYSHLYTANSNKTMASPIMMIFYKKTKPRFSFKKTKKKRWNK